MYSQRERMQIHNYYRDSRVQESMFSTCWKIIKQEQHEAIVSFDWDWLEDTVSQDEYQRSQAGAHRRAT